MIKRLIKSKSENQSDIDITPMLDVVFIMLIFFIVTASFVTEDGIGINKPTSTDYIEKEVKSMEVNVTSNEGIKIDNRIVEAGSIRPTITRLLAERPNSPVVVRVAHNATTKLLIQAVDGIRAANVEFPPVSLQSI